MNTIYLVTQTHPKSESLKILDWVFTNKDNAIASIKLSYSAFKDALIQVNGYNTVFTRVYVIISKTETITFTIQSIPVHNFIEHL